jgi:tyrosine-protein kinase Etk/Wzc
MEENRNNVTPQQSEEEMNIQELLFRYLIHWPWFVASVLFCVVCAFAYLKVATPVYNVSATVLIKDEDKGGGATMASELEKMGLGGMVSSASSVDNEIEVLKSKSLALEVVEQLNLYVSYHNEDGWLSKEMYRTSPVLVSLTPQEADKLEKPMKVKMHLLDANKLDVEIEVEKKKYQKHLDKLPAVFPTDEGTVAFLANPDTLGCPWGKVQNITATIGKPMATAKEYIKTLSIAPTSKTTSVVYISNQNSSTMRGKDFINKLIEVYNINTNNDKNEVAQKTAEFIDERISIISKELGSTEQDLENFKRSAKITDLSSEAKIALEGNAEYEKRRVENQTQISLVKDLQKYLHGNEFEVLPSNVGLQDAALATAIAKYNEMLMERNRLLRTSTENNPTIINLTSSIQAMRANVVASMDATLKGLQITKADLQREAKRFSQRISDAPTQERQFVSIARQQEIKAGLYLMLLQKREENAITLAATANNAKIIDAAIPDEAPVAPKKMMILLAALILGVGIPVGIIYLVSLTQVTIEGRADVEKLTTLPVIGDIPVADDLKGSSIAVFENQNNLMSETFRGIRTNLQFLLEEGQKVIMVTSTVSGEGKSFVSANTAISLSLLGKKVVIVGLDIRKPGLNKVFNLSTKEQGITQFLTDPKRNIMDLVQQSDINANLFILPGGAVPPNPTELLARKGLEEAIEQLKQHFDYIVLDTAPVGMVTDTQLISRVADLTVYVCRADYTRKSEFALVNELATTNKLPRISIAINGLDLKKKKYGYYYGYGKYGKYYGYGKRYGYGYGYGEHENNSKK